MNNNHLPPFRPLLPGEADIYRRRMRIWLERHDLRRPQYSTPEWYAWKAERDNTQYALDKLDIFRKYSK